jgi:hypothetical protein
VDLDSTPHYANLKKKMYSLLNSTHTYDFVVLTSLTHPRKILLVVLQIGKAKDLSAPLRITPVFVWKD